MPPSHHSSSSHSSHSSHRSSSSHSSSRSSSSHSYSSHSSGGYKYKGSSSSSSYTRPTRTKTNQPMGYPSTHANHLSYHCKKHDYTFYAQDWEYKGQKYRGGYYDENGAYYTNLAIKNNGEYKADLKCDYCGCKATYRYKDVVPPTCTQCGGILIIDDIYVDEVEPEPGLYDQIRATANSYNSKPKSSIWNISFVSLIAILACVIIGGFAFFSVFRSSSGSKGTEEVYDNIHLFGTNIYLKQVEEGIYEIAEDGTADKILSWSYYDEAYYDPESDGWLWYNTDVVPALWQYWWEGASSAYGDYGWMECEGNTWYVEQKKGDWIVYTGDTSRFWHIRNDFDE